MRQTAPRKWENAAGSITSRHGLKIPLLKRIFSPVPDSVRCASLSVKDRRMFRTPEHPGKYAGGQAAGVEHCSAEEKKQFEVVEGAPRLRNQELDEGEGDVLKS